MVEDDKFFAWLDGELAPGEAAEVERQVAADPELARRAAEHRALGAGLRDAFATVAAAPIPEALERAVRPEPSNVVELSGWRKRLARPFGGPGAQWAAMAATLALGLLVGTALNSGGGVSPVELRDGQIYAAGAIDQALDRQLASAGPDGDVRIGLTFRDQSGTICRSFEGAAASGLACRDDGDWRLRGLFAAPKGAATDYRMAAGPDPQLMELVDSAIAGEPFDAAQEQAARERGWR